LVASPGDQPIGDPIAQVRARLADSLARAASAGIARQAIVLDPGIGFFTASGVPAAVFNCSVLDRLRSLRDLGHPLLVGVSRKAFLGRIAGHDDPADRLAASLAATALAVYNGASIIRTHDVGATRDAVRVAQAIRAAQS
jgi:dihydropteroate synthase